MGEDVRHRVFMVNFKDTFIFKNINHKKNKKLDKWQEDLL